MATNVFLNYTSSGIRASINDNAQGNGNIQWITLTDPDEAYDIVADYLIICANCFYDPNNFLSDVWKIANYRATYNGFDVAILNADNLISDDLGFFYEGSLTGDESHKREQRIRTCIRRIYEGTNAQHTYDGKLGYVLLIGDSDPPSNSGMPTSYDNTWQPGQGEPFYPSDYYFSCVTKQGSSYDLTGDLFIGRFCVDNNLEYGLTELQNVVNKTIYYESEATFGGWRNETGVLMYHGFTNYGALYFDFMDGLVPSYFTVDKISGSQPDVQEQFFIK